MNIERDIQVSKDHASLAGHFPGCPVVPGVVLIDEVTAIVQSACQTLVLKNIRHIKFLKPLLPGMVCHISIEMKDNNNVVFMCRSEEQVIAKGKLVFADMSKYYE